MTTDFTPGLVFGDDVNDIHWPDCDRSTCTLNHTEDDAVVAVRRGWRAGDVLEGDEGHGVTRFEITAIGRQNLLGIGSARAEQWEVPWTLACRCWRKAAP